MKYDYSKLNGKIIERYGTYGKFCEEIGLTPNTLSAKRNNKSVFTQDEIVLFVEKLGIKDKDIPEYFFKKKVTVI